MIETNLIEDLRPRFPPDYEWPMAVVLALAILLAVVWLWRRLRRVPQPSGHPAAVTVGRSPGEIALAELERLTSLLRPEASREYGIAATGVVRTYIEQRYGLRAPRLATEEFLRVARDAPELPPEHRPHLGRFLEHCDLFKFGRYQASARELGELHAAAIGFVMASSNACASSAPRAEEASLRPAPSAAVPRP